jgi:hypothetical protein
MHDKPDDRSSFPTWLVVLLVTVAVVMGLGLCVLVPILLWYFGGS